MVELLTGVDLGACPVCGSRNLEREPRLLRVDPLLAGDHLLTQEIRVPVAIPPRARDRADLSERQQAVLTHVHKVRIALKELRETRYWLELILRAQLVARPDTLVPLIDEASQLIAILTASASTAKERSTRWG